MTIAAIIRDLDRGTLDMQMDALAAAAQVACNAGDSVMGQTIARRASAVVDVLEDAATATIADLRTLDGGEDGA